MGRSSVGKRSKDTDPQINTIAPFPCWNTQHLWLLPFVNQMTFQLLQCLPISYLVQEDQANILLPRQSEGEGGKDTGKKWYKWVGIKNDLKVHYLYDMLTTFISVFVDLLVVATIWQLFLSHFWYHWFEYFRLEYLHWVFCL